MFLINVVFVAFSVLFVCESAYVDTLPKCSIKDNDCMRDQYQKVLEDGRNGIPEFNIPPLDPMQLKDISINVLDAMTLTVTDGVAKGMTKCVFNKFSIDIEKHKGNIEAHCDVISVNAHFNVLGESPLVQGIIGSTNVNGQGKAKVKFENLSMVVEFGVYPEKINDDIHLDISSDSIKYTYDIGNAHFAAQKISIANKDISELISNYLNANWRQVMQTFGKIFIDKGIEVLMVPMKQFLSAVPAKFYISDDLSPYVKN